MGWGWGGGWYKEKTRGDLTAEGARRAGSCEKGDKVGGGPRHGRTGPWAAGERSEAWARGEEKAG